MDSSRATSYQTQDTRFCIVDYGRLPNSGITACPMDPAFRRTFSHCCDILHVYVVRFAVWLTAILSDYLGRRARLHECSSGVLLFRCNHGLYLIYHDGRLVDSKFRIQACV